MTAALINSFWKVTNLTWLTGPIFGKELRVSSRRKRNYVLRFAYLALLSVFVILVWLSMVESRGAATGAYQISRMSEAGKAVNSTISWFQFLATQLIAVVMLSTAISDEIYNRTLGVLMTTPINSFQIVMGKLFSKLLQLILLLAISLPLLAIIRVFGGVPWDYVLSSICITFTAALFAGSLSLYFSISGRRAYGVILRTLFVLASLYFLIPVTVIALLYTFAAGGVGVAISPPRWLISLSMFANPFVVLKMNTTTMMSPSVGRAMPFFSWPFHCAVMLAGSALLLARSVKIVRKVALSQATGQLETFSSRKRRRNKSKLHGNAAAAEEPAGSIREVKGSPVVWKELRAPLIQGAGGRNSLIGLFVTIIALFITYGTWMKQKLLAEDFAHIVYTLIFVSMGMIVNMVLSATSITSEKESRAWPILLSTSMNDWQILLGKAVGVFRRCLVIWLLLAGHLVLFISVRYIHPIAVVHLAMLVASIVVFLCGTGLYFSARFRRTTSAVVANFALAIVLWAIIPALLGLVSGITGDYDVFAAYTSANPLAEAGIIMAGAGGSINATAKLSSLVYNWPDGSATNIWPTTIFLTINMLVYMSLGFLFAWRAKCRFRRNIF